MSATERLAGATRRASRRAHRASDHTTQMVAWWARWIARSDLAVRRSDGMMIWHRGVTLTDDLLAWARAENAGQHADVYVRPARGGAWPLVLLDDVDPALAARIASKYGALVVHTSREGGCHVWIRCACALDEGERARAQRWLAARTGADSASVSGEHLGRLAGFKNWKRLGCWVNVERATAALPWDPRPALTATTCRPPRPRTHEPGCPPSPGIDVSPSGREWAWVCARLEAGEPPDRICDALLAVVAARRGRDAGRYARRTVTRAAARVRVARSD